PTRRSSDLPSPKRARHAPSASAGGAFSCPPVTRSVACEPPEGTRQATVRSPLGVVGPSPDTQPGPARDRWNARRRPEPKPPAAASRSRYPSGTPPRERAAPARRSFPAYGGPPVAAHQAATTSTYFASRNTDDAEPLAASGPGRFFGGPASLLLRRLRVEPGAVLCHGLRRGIDLGGVEVGPATRGPPWRRTCKPFLQVVTTPNRLEARSHLPGPEDEVGRVVHWLIRSRLPFARSRRHQWRRPDSASRCPQAAARGPVQMLALGHRGHAATRPSCARDGSTCEACRRASARTSHLWCVG